MRIVGIDPGISGAVGLLVDGKFERVEDMPTMLRGVTSQKQMVNDAELAKVLREMAPDKIVVELVNAAPRVPHAAVCPVCKQQKGGMGVASAFNFGDSAGSVRGVIGGLGVERHFVVPAVWKKRAGLIGNRDKEASRALAINHWPMAPLGRKKDSGRAEALLIARYGLKDAPVREPRTYTGDPLSGTGDDPFDPDAPPATPREALKPQALL